jgi:uncharacterized protein
MKTLMGLMLVVSGVAAGEGSLHSSPFWAAVKNGNAVAVRGYLASAPSLKDAIDDENLTALHVAAGRGRLGVVKVLLEAGANVHAIDRMGVSVLHKAVYSGVRELVEYLLNQGIHVNVVSPSNGNTPLHDAIYFRAGKGTEVIQALLNYGANQNQKNQAGLPAIGSARAVGFQEAVQILARHARWNHTVAGKKLMAAVLANDAGEVRDILAVSKDGLHERDEEGFTPLIRAARNGFEAVTGVLLQNGAIPEMHDRWMAANAGHKAAYWGRASIIPILAAYGWNPDGKGGYNGYTALHDAVARGHVETVRELLKVGARYDIEGHDGRTALQLAREHGNAQILALFP